MKIIFCYIKEKYAVDSSVKINDLGITATHNYDVVAKLDGEIIASHTSSTIEFAKHDIGITSDWQHKIYKKLCPNGYELKWLTSGEETKMEIK